MTLFLLVLMTGVASTVAQDIEEDEEDRVIYPDEIDTPLFAWEEASFDNDFLTTVASRTGIELSKLIFGELEGLKLFDVDVAGVRVGPRISRRVYDNKDIFNSWTVVDRLEIDGKIPIFGMSDGDASLGGGFAGFSIGTKQGIDFINVRQTIRSDYKKLPDLTEQKNFFEKNGFFIKAPKQARNFSESIDPEEDHDLPMGWIPSLDEEGNEKWSLLPFEPGTRKHAMYSKLWKIGAIPLKIPTGAESLKKKFDIGEIVSYSASGQLELGGNAGWALDPVDLVGFAKANISIRTFVRGAFRVTILREDENHVLVKFTHLLEKGIGTGLGGEIKLIPFEGMIVLEELHSELKIIPFRLEVRRESLNKFDVAYRYDLRIPHAREAFENALLGRMGASHDLSFLPDGTPRKIKASGVEHAFTRDTQSSSSVIQNKLKLTFAYTENHTTRFRLVNTVITDHEGTHHRFQALVENSRRWRFLFQIYEKFKYNFSVNVDVDEYDKNPRCATCMNLVIEGRINDPRTYRDEMMDYILEVENSVGQFGLFPRPPDLDKPTNSFLKFMEDSSEVLRIPIRHFGETRFYYRLNLTQQQINAIIDYPDEWKWKAIERAFGVQEGSWSSVASRTLWQAAASPLTVLNAPLYVADLNIRPGSILLHARILKSRWDKLYGVKKVKERAERLGRLFFDHLFSYELIYLVRTVLEGQKVQYYSQGSSQHFGRKFFEGNTELSFSDRATQRQKKVDFELTRPELDPEDPIQVVHDLVVKPINPWSIELRFRLEQQPEAMFFQLYKEDKGLFKENEKKAQFVFFNRDGKFQKGWNYLVLDRRDPESAWYPLMKPMHRGRKFLLRTAMNLNGSNWGRVSEAQWRMKDNRARMTLGYIGPTFPNSHEWYRVKDLKAKSPRGNTVEIDFNLARAPMAVYFQLLLEERNFLGQKKHEKVGSLTLTQEEFDFAEGANQLRIQTDDPKSPFYELFEKVEHGKKYVVRVSLNPSGIRWGEYSAFRFNTRSWPKPIQEEDEKVEKGDWRFKPYMKHRPGRRRRVGPPTRR